MRHRRRDILWAAGLFDAEGTFYYNDGRPRAMVRLRNKAALEEFARIVGTGNVTGPYGAPGRDGVTRVDIYSWSKQGEEATRIINRLRPYAIRQY